EHRHCRSVSDCSYDRLNALVDGGQLLLDGIETDFGINDSHGRQVQVYFGIRTEADMRRNAGPASDLGLPLIANGIETGEERFPLCYQRLELMQQRHQDLVGHESTAFRSSCAIHVTGAAHSIA